MSKILSLNFAERKKSCNFADAKPLLSGAEAQLYGPGGGMVDALVSGASGESRAGSSPVLGTISASYRIGFTDFLTRIVF